MIDFLRGQSSTRRPAFPSWCHGFCQRKHFVPKSHSYIAARWQKQRHRDTRQLHIPPNVRCNLNEYPHNVYFLKLKSIKSFIILIIILAFLGCQSQENKNRPVSIDYSYFDGYYRCIKINRNGQVYLQYDYDYPERHEKYTFKLNDS